MNRSACGSGSFLSDSGGFCGNQVSSKPVKVGVVVSHHVGVLLSHRFTLPGGVDIDGTSYEELSPEDKPARDAKASELRKRRELLQLVDFSR